MGIQECERKWEYWNMKEMGIQEYERKREYRNTKGNGNRGM
jgi:hypothetical protein